MLKCKNDLLAKKSCTCRLSISLISHSVLTDSQHKGESESYKFHDGGLEWKKR